MPFRLDEGFLILVEGRIGTLGPLRFVLDTGATRTVIERRIAERLGLTTSRARVVNFDREVELERATVPELEVGPLRAKDMRVLVGDLKELSQFAESIDGIIGLDVLRSSQSMRVDFRDRKVTFVLTEGDCEKAEAERQVALTVKVAVQGRAVRMIVDTGLSSLLFYEGRLRRDVPGLRVDGEKTQGSTGRLKIEAARVPGIDLGDEAVPPMVLLLPGAPDTLPADIDGYLGTSALHAEMIELDFAGNQLRFRRVAK